MKSEIKWTGQGKRYFGDIRTGGIRGSVSGAVAARAARAPRLAHGKCSEFDRSVQFLGSQSKERTISGTASESNLTGAGTMY